MARKLYLWCLIHHYRWANGWVGLRMCRWMGDMWMDWCMGKLVDGCQGGVTGMKSGVCGKACDG